MCEMCGKIFRTKQILKRHEDRMDHESLQYYCPDLVSFGARIFFSLFSVTWNLYSKPGELFRSREGC